MKPLNETSNHSNILYSSVYVRLLGLDPELAQINLQIASIQHYIYL